MTTVNRVDARFASLREQGRAGLVPFVTGGDPDFDTSLAGLHAMVEAGADVLEIGMPFSDPQIDGPVIQRGNERALGKGMTLARVLEMVAAFRTRDSDTPIVLMGYLNPIEQMGEEAFVGSAAKAGVDGVLVVDMPPEESETFRALLTAQNLVNIELASPTTTSERMARICSAASGYLYYVAIKGITGAGHMDTDSVETGIGHVRAHTKLPVGVGVGVRDAQSAMRIARHADAVIVGTVLVERIEALADQPAAVPGALASLMSELSGAIRSASSDGKQSGAQA